MIHSSFLLHSLSEVIITTVYFYLFGNAEWGETEEGEVSTRVRTMKTSLLSKLIEKMMVDISVESNFNRSPDLDLHIVPLNPAYKPCSKTIMPNMTVQKLKMLLKRMLKVTAPIKDVKVISSRVST